MNTTRNTDTVGVIMRDQRRRRWSLADKSALVRRTYEGGVQAEAVDVGAQRLLELRLPWHRALHRQHLLAGARTEGDAVRTRGGLKRPEYTGLVRIAVAVGHVG